MRIPLLCSILLPAMVNAQTLWPVSVGGSTLNPLNLPYYSPQHLTINVGDEVRWTNASGTHNANGSLALFPGNPEGFSSGNPASGSWSYTKTFTIPGLYNYHCTSDGHSATQFGSITVVDPSTGLAQLNEAPSEVRVYPSPAREFLFIEAGMWPFRSIRIVSLNGDEQLVQARMQSTPITVDISSLSSGNYFVLLTEADGRMLAKPFAKE